MFNPDITDRSEFETESFTYNSSDKQALEKIYDPDYNGTDGSKDDGEETRVVFQDKVQLNQVFSGVNFAVALNLGALSLPHLAAARAVRFNRTISNFQMLMES